MKGKFIYSCLLIIVTLGGCKKLLEVPTPQDRLVTQKVFENDETCISAMGGLYASMLSNINFPLPYNIALYCGLYADELELKTTDIARTSVYRNALLATNSPTNSIWTRSYFFIYEANNIIEGLEKSTGVAQPLKRQLMGECYFLRAFWHFYLTNLYGDIPLVTTTNYSVNSTMSRTSSTLIYQQMISDLIKAKALMSEKYVGGDGITEVADRVRPNIYAVMALLSRIYLYTERWKEAEDEATEILSKNSMYILEPITNVFKASSKEAIWQLQMPTNSSGTTTNANTYEGQYFVLNVLPSAGNSGSVIRPSLLNMFTANDQRKNNWIATFTTATSVSYVYPAKYKSRAAAAPLDERSAVFRLAEVYLIRSEARAQLNNFAGAVTDLDAIRGRAGTTLISSTNPNISKEELQTAILEERQRELFCEWGHRWLDLRRTKKVDDIMSIVAPQKGGVWSTTKTVWPIPLVDIQNNPKITQNEGYN